MPGRIEKWRPPVYMTVRSTKEHDHYNTADWQVRRRRIAVRDAYTCRSCGRVSYGKSGHADHIVPLEDGGSNEDLNLQWLCGSCHGRKTRCEQRRKGAL